MTRRVREEVRWNLRWTERRPDYPRKGRSVRFPFPTVPRDRERSGGWGWRKGICRGIRSRPRQVGRLAGPSSRLWNRSTDLDLQTLRSSDSLDTEDLDGKLEPHPQNFQVHRPIDRNQTKHERPSQTTQRTRIFDGPDKGVQRSEKEKL